jgi:hypothetical protein
MPTWHVPLVPVSLPVLLLGQQVLLVELLQPPLEVEVLPPLRLLVVVPMPLNPLQVPQHLQLVL